MTLVTAVLTIFIGGIPAATIHGKVEAKACAMHLPHMENDQGQRVTATVHCEAR